LNVIFNRKEISTACCGVSEANGWSIFTTLGDVGDCIARAKLKTSFSLGFG